MAANDWKNGTSLHLDIEVLSKIFTDSQKPSAVNTIIFTDGDVKDTDPTIFMHEIQHGTGIGKTGAVKAAAKNMGIDIVTLDMSTLQSSEQLDALMGHPAGYEGFNSGRGGLKEEWALSASRQNGEELAAACRDGVSATTTCMKPFRIKDGNNGFMTMGAIWS